MLFCELSYIYIYLRKCELLTPASNYHGLRDYATGTLVKHKTQMQR